MLGSSESWPAHAAAHGTHDAMFSMIMNHIEHITDTTICDIPCGAGLFSRRISDAGMKVTAVDIAAVEPYLFETSRRILADANHGLPFEANQFDALVTIEGIEHLENPTGFLRECARVVKPGGWIFLSTPNVDSFRSRKYVMFRGYHRFFGPQGDAAKDSGHLLPIDMIFFKGAAERVGLKIVDITVNHLPKNSFFRKCLRMLFTRKLPASMRNNIPFYGDVIIYALHKPQ